MDQTDHMGKSAAEYEIKTAKDKKKLKKPI